MRLQKKLRFKKSCTIVLFIFLLLLVVFEMGRLSMLCRKPVVIQISIVQQPKLHEFKLTFDDFLKNKGFLIKENYNKDN